MGVDFKEALTYVFKDKSWKLKFAVLTVIMFTDILLTIFNYNFILNIPLLIFTAGFNMLLMNNLINRESTILPDLNIKKTLKEGLKIYGIFAVFSIVYISISAALLIFWFLTAIFASIAVKFGIVSSMNSINIAILVETYLCLLIIFIFTILFLIIFTLTPLLFSESLSFKEAFNIKKCLNVFRYNWVLYILLFLLLFIVNIPLGFYYNVSYIYDNKTILIPAVLLSTIVSVFLFFLYTNIQIQIYKQSLAKIKSDELKLESIKHPFNSFDYKVIAMMIIVSLSATAVIFSMPMSENSPLGKLFAQINYKSPLTYEFYHNASCQSDRYMLNNPVLFPVIKDGKFGYINKTGKIVIEPEFAYADDFYHGLARVIVGGKNEKPSLYDKNITGGKYGFIDTKGNFVIKPVFDYASNFDNEKTAFVRIGNDNKYIDGTGKYIKNSNTFHNELSKVRIGRKYGFKDKSGNIVIDPVYDNVFNFFDGIARVEKHKKMGAIDMQGQVVIDIKYDYLSNFREGLAVIVLNNKYGYINKDGKVVIRPQFKDACSFSEGLADARYNKLVGYIDKTGKFIIKPQYAGNYGFINGIAPVHTGDKWGYVDKKGNYIWKPTN